VASRLDEIRDEEAAHLYPQDRLAGCRTGLALFAACFLGKQDCVWIADAGITATAVDIDGDQLHAMQPLYPAAWSFEQGDVFEYAARRYAEGATYDLVNLDPPTQLFDETAAAIELWTGLADKVVVIGTRRPDAIEVTPDGWEETAWLFRSSRNGGAYWVVLEPIAA
jgi:hypothetical protein